MKELIDLMEEIMTPSNEFTPVPFWFFNDNPEQAEIERQMEDFADKGVNGLVLHPRIGIPQEISYLSEEFFRIVKMIVKKAAELDMKIVLYDEGMYPSGSAHGMVVEGNPEFASRGITRTDDPGTNSVLTRLADGKFLITGYTNGTIRGIHFGEDDGEAYAPKSADILNPRAVERFIHLTHDRYYEELKEYFGNTIIGFFTDEPCALGRNAESFREWADGMEKEILAAGGRLEELEGLFLREENDTTAIYHKLVKKHLRETFYMPLAKWCQDHGILFMGHPAESDDVEEELYFHVPGQDLIMRRVVPKTGGLLEKDSVQAKLSADIARHLGRRRNSNECFGVCCRDHIPWYFTGEDMKWYIDWLGMRGVNLFIPHAFYYSVAGKRKDERPPDVGPNNIWWSNYRKFSDYMKRISFLMTDSVNGAKVAVLCDNNQVPCGEVVPLYEHQVEFNYLPVSLLKDSTVKDGKLCIQEYAYEIVINLINNRYDESLTGISVLHSKGEIMHLAENRVQSALPSVETDHECRALRATHLVKYGIDLYLLSNEGEKEIRQRMKIKEHGTCVLIDLWSGSYRLKRVEETTSGLYVDIGLSPCETALILIDKKHELRAEYRAEPIAEDWTDRFRLKEKNKNQAVYEYRWQVSKNSSPEVIEVTGEEMAECFCNGEPAGVSFWNPHRFHIGPHLKCGENQIEIVMTGNAANIYSGADLFYGLKS